MLEVSDTTIWPRYQSLPVAHLHGLVDLPQRSTGMRNRRNRDVLEAGFWVLGLAAMAIADPSSPGLYSICPFDAVGNWIGLSFCPGCGLGHAVAHLARGEFALSFAAHPLAVPAVLVLTTHATSLLKRANTTL